MACTSARYFELLKEIIDIDYGPDRDDRDEIRSELISELRREGRRTRSRQSV